MNAKLARQRDVMQSRVDRFNESHPVGTAVRYWTGFREGEGKVGRTRSAAFLLGGHTASIMIEGASGSIALSHVEPIAAEGQTDG